MFNDRKGNDSLNSSFKNTPETFSGARNLTKQDIQIPSIFYNNTTKYFPNSPITHNTEQKKYPLPTNNTTIYIQTSRRSKLLSHGLSNV